MGFFVYLHVCATILTTDSVFLLGTFTLILKNRNDPRYLVLEVLRPAVWTVGSPRCGMRVWNLGLSFTDQLFPLPAEVASGLLAQSGSTWPLFASVGFVPRPWCPAVRSRWSGQWRTWVVEWSTWFNAAPMCFCGSGFLPRALAGAQVHLP